MMMRISRWLPALLVLMLVAGCGMPKKNAEQGLHAAEIAYQKIMDRARNVTPDQAQGIEAGLAQARSDLEKGSVEAAAKEASVLAGQIQSLSEQLPDLEAKLQAEWKDLTGSVPGALTALRQKLNDVGRPPAGMPERAMFDSTRAQVAPLSQRWDEALSLFVSGKVAQAVALGEAVKADAVRLVTGLQAGS